MIYIYNCIYITLLSYLYYITYGIYKSFWYYKLEFNLNKFFVSMFFCNFILYLYMRKPFNICKRVIVIFYFVQIIPVNIYFYMANAEIEWYFICIATHLLLLFLVKLPLKVKIKRISKINKIIEKLLILFIIVISLIIIIKYKLFFLKALNFKNVYYIRRVNKVSGILAYLIPVVSKVGGIFFLGKYVIDKEKKYMVMILFTNILPYIYFGHKSILIMPIAFIILAKISYKKNNMVYMYLLLIIILLLGISIHKITGQFMPIALLERTFIVPTHLSNLFYKFFDENPYSHYSIGLIGKMFNIKARYNVSDLGFLISREFLNNDMMRANTGYLFSAFSEGGLIAVFIETFILGLILLMIRIKATLRNEKGIFIMIAYFFYSTINGKLTTNLLTNGGLLLILIIMFYKFEKGGIR